MNRVKKNLKYFLKDKLPLKELEQVNRSFRILGNIAMVEIPDCLSKKEKIIGNAVLGMNKNVSTVVKKESQIKGVFRTRKTKIIAGKRTKMATLKENGCVFHFNIDEVFFSDSSGSERKRISSLVKKGEEVMVLFSGIAPFNCVIAKNSKAKSVYGIEINKKAHKFGLNNVKLNKLNNVFLYEGDVVKLLPKLRKKFDRIVIHFPAESYSLFSVPLALNYLKKGGFLHIYFFVFVGKNNKKSVNKKLSLLFSAFDRKFKIMNIQNCLSVSPSSYKVCVDVKIM